MNLFVMLLLATISYLSFSPGQSLIVKSEQSIKYKPSNINIDTFHFFGKRYSDMEVRKVLGEPDSTWFQYDEEPEGETRHYYYNGAPGEGDTFMYSDMFGISVHLRTPVFALYYGGIRVGKHIDSLKKLFGILDLGSESHEYIFHMGDQRSDYPIYIEVNNEKIITYIYTRSN